VTGADAQQLLHEARARQTAQWDLAAILAEQRAAEAARAAMLAEVARWLGMVSAALTSTEYLSRQRRGELATMLARCEAALTAAGA
jgi:hypothetical protein